MAITLDVITKVVEESLRSSGEVVDREMTKAGEKAGENLAKAIAQAVAKSPELQKSMNRVGDATGKVRVEQEKLNAINAKANSTNAQKVAQSERLQKAKRDEATAVRETARAYEDYSRTTTVATNKIDDINRSASMFLNTVSALSSGTRFGGIAAETANMASGFAAAGAAAGGFRTSLLASGLVAGGAAVLGLAAVTAGIYKSVEGLYKLGAAWSDTFDGIQIQTGATGVALEGIKDAVREVAGEVPSTIQSIGQVAAEVFTQFKVSGTALEELTESLAILQHSGIQVDIQSLGRVMRQFKVETSDTIPAIEEILAVSQDLGVPFNKLTQTMYNGAAGFQQFDMSLTETLSLLSSFEGVGIPTNRAINSMTKAAEVLSAAGLEPTQENLQAVFDEITAIANGGSIERATQLLNDLFGLQGGASWNALLKNGLNLDELSDPANIARTSIQGLADDTFSLSEEWTMFKNELSATLEPLSTELRTFAAESLGSIMDWIKENREPIIDFFISVGDIAIGTLSSIQSFIGTTLNDTGMILEVFSKIIGGIATLEGWAANLPGQSNRRDNAEVMREWQKSLDDLSESMKGAGKTVKDGLAAWDELRTRYRKAGEEAKENARETKAQADAARDSADAAREQKDALEELGKVPYGPYIIDQENPITPGDLGGLLGDGGGMQKFAPSGAFTPGGSYGLPAKASINYGQPGFPSWVYQVADAFGMEASTYPNHQVFGGKNKGIDWRPKGMSWDSPEGARRMQRFSEYLRSTGMMEQVIYENAITGKRIGVANGKPVGPGTDQPGYYRDDWAGHRDHIHTRQSRPIPLPGSRIQKFSSNVTPQSSMMKMSGPSSGIMPLSTSSDSPLPPGVPSPVPGLQDGPVGSSFGYNEFGEPGYYRPDSRSIRSAERREEDARERVEEADKRVAEAEAAVAEAKAEKALLTSITSLEERERVEKQLEKALEDVERAKKQAKRNREDAVDARTDLEEARRGRFSAAREATAGRGASGRMGDIGAPLEDDFGLSDGLPGIAQWLITFLGNMAFAPMLGSLSAIAAASPIQGGYGAFGVMGAQNMAAGGSPLGFTPTAGVSPITPSIGPAPIGGGVGAPLTPAGTMTPGTPHGVGQPGVPTPAGPATPMTSQAPGAASPGGGFKGVGGLPLAAMQTAAMGAELLAPGAGQAAQTAIEIANRTIGYVGQLGAIGVGGLLETFLPNNSDIADPSKSWVGKLAAGFAGASPASPNAAGTPAPAQPPSQSSDQQGSQGGPMVNIENMINQTPDGGQTVANQVARLSMAGYSRGSR